MSEQQKGQQMRFSDRELGIIKNVFKDDEMLKLLRKVFLPELDPTLPIGQMIDLWMTIDIKDKTPEEALIEMKARNTVIMHLEQQLAQLKVLANMEDETPEQQAKRLIKDSSK